jgi:hypothetical protein
MRQEQGKEWLFGRQAHQQRIQMVVPTIQKGLVGMKESIRNRFVVSTRQPWYRYVGCGSLIFPS